MDRIGGRDAKPPGGPALSAGAERAIDRALPALKGLARETLGAFPAPVEPLDLAAVVPSFHGAAWVKREDLSATDLGGNKVRKLEYLLGDALEAGARTVVAVGGVGSNHCLATAFYAPESGIAAHLVVYPHHATPSSRRTLAAITALGPHVTWCPTANATPAVMAAEHSRLRVAGRRPYLVMPGGSSVAGTLGAVDLGLEIAEQIAGGDLGEPDAIVVPYGSGGTVAGLATGLHIAGVTSEVVAVRVYDLPATTAWWVRSIAWRTMRRIRSLGGHVPRGRPRIRVLGEYLGPGYAEPTAASAGARDAAAVLGLELDPTYTAKAFAALLDLAAGPYRDKRLLFVQTYDSRIPEGLTEGLDPDVLPRPLRSYL